MFYRPFRRTALKQHSQKLSSAGFLLRERTCYFSSSATNFDETKIMDADEFRKSAHAAVEEIIKYQQAVASGELPVLPEIKPGYLAPQLPTTAPQQPESWINDIQPDISSKIIPGLTNWQSPDFMAFFPATTSFPSILGEMYSSAFSAPAFNWLCSPVCTELETVVMDWLAKAFHLPDVYLSNSSNGGGGVIQGSASEAIVTCMVAARERYLHRKCDAEGLPNPSPERDERIAGLRGKLVALSSDQAHSSTQKGANVAGTRYRSIPTSFEHQLALQPAELEAAIEQCYADGLEPYYITLSMGTTSTCATDPFAALEQVLKKYPNIWVHIDAAYAGTALICPEVADVLPSSSLKMADSFNTNMHKWLLVNFDASCLWVRRRTDLTAALSISPAYLQNKHTDSGLVTDYRDWQIPLGRRFRAIKIWFVVRSYGIEGLRAHVRNGLRNGKIFMELLHSPQGKEMFELVAEPAYGLVCFRIKPSAVPVQLIKQAKAGSVHESSMNGTPNGTTEHLANGSTDEADTAEQLANTLSKKVTDTINERRQFFLTSSTTHGKSFIRVVSGNANANEHAIREVFNTIVKTTGEFFEGKI